MSALGLSGAQLMLLCEAVLARQAQKPMPPGPFVAFLAASRAERRAGAAERANAT